MTEQQSVPPQPPAPDVSPDATGGVIPYKNPAALASYYMGLFSIIPFVGFLLAPAAFVCGIIGLKKQKQHPNAKGGVHAWIGIIFGGLLFPVHLFATVGLVGAMLSN